MEISERLKRVASMVRYEKMADIGTDHGYVPIYLYKQGKVKKAIACDMNKGPLEKAKENIFAYSAQDVIESRLGYGLSPLAIGEVESVVIAGMGGMLVISILQENLATVHDVKELILSPQSDLESVRRYLHTIGFCIEKEEMLLEDGKFYTILRAVHGTEQYHRKIDYLYGKYLLDEENAVLKTYLEAEYQRTLRIFDHLQKHNSIASQQRIIALGEERNRLEEAMSCL